MTGVRILAEKSPGLREELERADQRLQVLVFYAAALSVEMFGAAAVLTCVARNHDATKAFHGENAAISPHETSPTRAADLRTRGLFDDLEAEAWQDEINRRFEYSSFVGPGRFRAALYETQTKMLRHGRNPQLPPVVPHLHLQVPPWESSAAPIVRLWTAPDPIVA